MSSNFCGRNLAFWLVLLMSGTAMGCACCHKPIDPSLPNERAKIALPPYVIEPPDVLQINAIQLVPKPPYKIRPFDVILVQFPASGDTLKKEDLEDLEKAGRRLGANYVVEPEGTVNLGPIYGNVTVTEMTIDKAREAITERLKLTTKKELVDAGKVRVELVQSRAMQQVLGDHLVRIDGTVGLGTYGGVFVSGLTLYEAKKAIESHLSEFVVNPEISLDVSGFNSKVYYVIFGGGAFGDQVMRIPATGNETVLDAIGQVYGLSAVASRSHIWIARPGMVDEEEHILPVDWNAITRRGSSTANYQIVPGDRLFVEARPIICLDENLGLFLAPMQRVLGATILGVGAYNAVKFAGQLGGLGLGGGSGI